MLTTFSIQIFVLCKAKIYVPIYLKLYRLVAEISNIRHEISDDVDNLHACKCDKFAHARALSHRTCAQTMV